MSPPPLPTRLLAPPPGWSVQADVVVVGSGVAGLTTALRARRVGRVLLVTKTVLEAGATAWAQGGVAAALDPEDSPEQHLADTLAAGVGLCDETVARVTTVEGPARVRELVELGARFETTSSGSIALTREGGHLRDRIAHAGGDATGREISRALVAAVAGDAGIEVVEHALVTDVLTDARGRACGVALHVLGVGERDGLGAALGRAVVLATGGIGQVFHSTTNPPVATGDGVAAALRAGASVADLEFVQFHPTVLWLGAGSAGQQALVSEALRGEGARLVDTSGRRFMVGRHPLGDLAPRDVVAKGVLTAMAETGAEHVWLDARHLGRDLLEARFPSIVASCRSHGIDPAVDLVPVAPAQHFASGGVRTDLHGRTSLPGLYACGEVACTGLHGANRLASNSLLEGLVFGEHIARDLAAAGLPRQADPVQRPLPDALGEPAALVDGTARLALQRATSAGAGVVRDAAGLAAAASELARLAAVQAAVAPSSDAWETTNIHTVATALVEAATVREETRGGHWRADFPERDDVHWRGRLVHHLDPDGGLVTSYEPLPVPLPA